MSRVITKGVLKFSFAAAYAPAQKTTAADADTRATADGDAGSCAKADAAVSAFNADGEMLDRALATVREFIVAKRLIIFGGLAVDYALRLRGERIYPDDERPDYDFFSPRSVDDAYELADILIRAGFPAVGVVRGIHVQTMRVRTDHLYVADIGYCPPAVFTRLPTLEWGGMRVLHPDFQRIDQHLAFCFPFNDAPREDVFHRWRKDLRRFNLVSRMYPIAARATPVRDAFPRAVRLACPVASPRPDTTVAIHGFAAYGLIRAAADLLGVSVKAPLLPVTFPDDHSLAFTSPADDPVVFASPTPNAALPDAAPVKHYAPYMDICPEGFMAADVLVYSTASRLLSVSLVDVNVAGTAQKTCVVSPQLLLVWLLYRAALTGNSVYRDYYAHTLEVLREAEKACAARGVPIELFAKSPFAPSVAVVMGTTNHNPAYLIRAAMSAEKVTGTSKDTASKMCLSTLPRNYYGRGVPPTFDYDACPFFRRDGMEIE